MFSQTNIRFALVLAFLAACASTAPEEPQSRSRFVLLDGKRVHYQESGAGDRAVVFVHGWAGDHSFWRFQVDALRGRARVLAVDLPGHGGSEAPLGKHTMDLYVRALEAVLDDAGVKRAILVGHSNGTAAILHFHRLHAKRTRGLVAVEGALRPILEPAQVAELAEPLRSAEYLAFTESIVDGMLPAHMDGTLRKDLRTRMLATPQEVLAGSFEAANDPAVWTRDPIRTPLLAVHAHSPFWTDEYEAFVRKRAPHVEYVVITNVSHFLMMDRPAVFNDLLLDFLART